MIDKINTNTIKFIKMQPDEMILSLDRLTRFKYPETKYYRVFSEIISKYLIEPKLSKKQIQNLNANEISEIVKIIWNSSLINNKQYKKLNQKLNKAIRQEIKTTYNINEYTKELTKTQLDIVSVLDFIKEEKNIPINLKWLLFVKNETYSPIEFRNKYNLRFPIEKVVLCEGITEEILLPPFCNLAGYNFNKNGIKLISAGGKNQVAKLYCELKSELKIPIFVLLDADALEISKSIEKIIRPIDKIYLIKHGEFEDIFSLTHIKRTINNRFKNICECVLSDFQKDEPMTKILTEFYRTHELGDYQKADFAKDLAESLKYKTDLTDELLEIVNSLKK